VVCIAPRTVIGAEGPGVFSTTEGDACPGEVCVICTGAVFECTSGVDSWGSVDMFCCEVLMWGRISKKRKTVSDFLCSGDIKVREIG